MERITTSLDDALLADFDEYLARKGYQNRSEAVRDLIRDLLGQEPSKDQDGNFSIGLRILMSIVIISAIWQSV